MKHNFVYFSSPPKGAILRAAEAAAVDKGEQLPPPAMPVGATATLLASQVPVTQGIFKGQGPLHGTPLLGPYSAVSPVDKRRIAARKFGTTFVYDFISVRSCGWSTGCCASMIDFRGTLKGSCVPMSQLPLTLGCPLLSRLSCQ